MGKGDQLQRTTKEDAFATLKSNRGIQLGTTVERAVPDQNDPYEYRPLSTAATSDAADAETEFLDQLQTHKDNDVSRKRSRGPRISNRSGMDVYRANTVPPAVSSRGTTDEQYAAIIRELQGPIKVKISQMIEELGKTKTSTKQIELSVEAPVETPVKTKFQKMFDDVMKTRYGDNSDPVQPPQKESIPTRVSPWKYHIPRLTSDEALKLAGIPRKELPPVVMDNPVPSGVFPSLVADKPSSNVTQDSDMQLECSSMIGSLLDELRNERSDIVGSVEKQSQKGASESSSPAEQSASLARSERARSSGPLFWRGRWDNSNRSSTRMMSTASQGEAVSVDAADCQPLLPSGLEVLPSLKTRKAGRPPKTGPKQSRSDEASKVLETLHPKSKQSKASRSPKSESKAKKTSRAKSKDKESGVEGRQSNSQDRRQARRARAREFRKTVISTPFVRKLTLKDFALMEFVQGKSGKANAPAVVRKHILKDIAPMKFFRGHSYGGKANAPAVETVKGRRRSVVGRTSRSKRNVEIESPRKVQQTSLPLNQSNERPTDVTSIDATELKITPLDISQPSLPGLQYGLDRVLFNSGVVQLQDPHSRVFNFDPYLQKIMPVVEFDYNALKQYKTSSQDTALSTLAKENGKRYIGSTSSMTGTLGHFHYLISGFRPLNLKMLSRSFPDNTDTFTQINRAPNAIFLRKKDDGVYAIDVDKEYDGANVLMMLGKSMEKLLTLPKADYERYRKENSHSVTEEERTAPEAYEYTIMGDFLMRSQLDAYDSRLPGTGKFDLKTRAVVSVRMDASNYEPMTGYEIKTLQGRFQSYEREYYDMMRSTMLKYMLQVRIGRMDGIFLAYHNVERIFGFQYIPLPEIDRAIHSQSDPCLGDQEFKVSLELLNKALNAATAKFPDKSLRLHFEATQEDINGGSNTTMWIYAEPMAEDEINRIQATSHAKTAEFERTMMGIEKEADDVGKSDIDFHAPEAVVESDGSEETTIARPVEELAILSDSDANLPSETEAPPDRNEESESTSASNANEKFVNKLEDTHPSRELGPLFVASIICTSQVNGSSVLRPEHLKPEHKWEVKYYFQEWDTTEAMWARYEDMKSRRKGIFEQYRKEKEDEAEEGGEEGVGKKKKRNGYIEVLRSMSQAGRDFRERLDELDALKAPVVVGQPLYSADGGGESIEGLDDYLGWLYRSDAHNSQET